MITRAEVLAALPEWVTAGDAAALAGVSRFAVYERARAGRLATRTATRRGREVLEVRTADVLAWRDARRGCKGQAKAGAPRLGQG